MDRKDKLYIPASQKTQVLIHVKEIAFMFFTEYPTEGANRFIADLVFKTVFHVTTGGTTFATDPRAETITILDSKRREGSSNVTSRSILREGKQRRTLIDRA